MKCVECVDYAECSKKHNLTIKRKHCPMAKVEYVQTNADRIRAMSDEELVDLFGHNSICDYVQDHSSKHCEEQGSCDKCLLKWLKQPAEENK